MKQKMIFMGKIFLALAAICWLLVLAARDLAPGTPALVVLAYALGGAAIVVMTALGAMWLKFAINQFMLNVGATDTQWLWFKNDPKGLVALRRRRGKRQSNSDT